MAGDKIESGSQQNHVVWKKIAFLQLIKIPPPRGLRILLLSPSMLPIKTSCHVRI